MLQDGNLKVNESVIREGENETDEIIDVEIVNEDKESKTHCDIVLIEQYKLAIDLYKHEDSLTWSKVHYFLIVTGVIFALGNWIPVCDYTMRAITGAAGFVISLLFFITISNGFKYLLVRKQVATNIEKKLLRKEPKQNLIFDKGTIEGKFGLTTRTAVKIFIVLVAIAWGITFSLALLQ